MKKILIVTGSDYTDRVYEGFLKIKERGHLLYLLSDGSFEPKPGIFTKHFCYDLRKTKETLDYMKSQKESFDAVTIKTSEWLTPLVALLAKQYQCIGNDPLTAFCCRSKYHMRNRLKEANIPQPNFELCRNFEELKSAIKKIKIPCVAKPVGGNASYGTFMIRDLKDLENLKKQYEESIKYLKQKAIEEDVFAFSEDEMKLIGVTTPVNMITDYLVEEFMEGPEISVDALTQNGQTTIFGIEDQERMEPPYFLQLAANLPYQCSPEKQKEIEVLIKKTIDAIGIENSASHTEIIFTNQGPKIVEIGCRIGGDDLHDTIFELTGYNLMFESILVALGEKRSFKVVNKCHTRMEFIMPKKAGVIKKINIPTDLYKNEDIFNIELTHKAGDRVGLPPENFDYIGFVSAKGNTSKEAKQTLSKALKKIKVEIQ